MPPIVVMVLAVAIVVIGIFYQVYLSPLLEVAGAFRKVEPLNNNRCEAVEGLQACEKFVIHSSGLLYLACAPSTRDRVDWAPAGDKLNATAFRTRSDPDYVATYNLHTPKITKLQMVKFVEPRGISTQGMDVVPDEHDPDLLWIYLVNHRPPVDSNIDYAVAGADSVIEIFKTRVGADTMEWVKTVEDASIIVTPNDVLGSANGKEFWVTNDNSKKVGLTRIIHLLFHVKATWVGYCHIDKGCRIAADELYHSNGIVRASNGQVWIGSSGGGYITVHEQQEDKTLVPVEVVQIGRATDNLSLGPDGSIVVATFPDAIRFVSQSAKNPNIPCPASVHRISVNNDRSSYFGERYKVEKIFEEDGTMLGSSASTAAIYGNKLYMHGVIAARLLVCELPA
ncbi:serum paraoxonase/arylesterase [Ceratobasidium sp. AG-Ba]|nr:serum paraoxonase/arylesterase [Ceratobasidium sp. AG-Ba]